MNASYANSGLSRRINDESRITTVNVQPHAPDTVMAQTLIGAANSDVTSLTNQAAYAGNSNSENFLTVGGSYADGGNTSVSIARITGNANYSDRTLNAAVGGASYSRNGVWNASAAESHGDSFSTVNHGGSRITVVGIHPHALGGIMTSPHIGLVAESGPEAVIPLSPNESARGMDIWRQAGEILGVPSGAASISGETSPLISTVNAPALSANQPQMESGVISAPPFATLAGVDSPAWTFDRQESAVFGFLPGTERNGDAPRNPAFSALYSMLYPEDGDDSDGGGQSPNVSGMTGGAGNTIRLEIRVDQHNEYNVDGKDLDESKVVAIINAHSLDNANELVKKITKEISRAFANTPLKGRA